MSAVVVPKTSVKWNPDAPVFLPAAHRKTCGVISRFFQNNHAKINANMAVVFEGEEFQQIHDGDGCIWMEGFTFCIEFYIPLKSEPPAGFIDQRRVINRINRLISDLGCSIDTIDMQYETQYKRLVIQADITCYDG